ncbi:concanavalin A-like lectin/glucanase domain-containing protein [Auriculariales sp. MPI-PUGE-AT-0066]|nr:concanavalin A-like lectin/glucanase domain-containing protein [Auriculariales sp. MPI-PUGE-AT-0066]
MTRASAVLALAAASRVAALTWNPTAWLSRRTHEPRSTYIAAQTIWIPTDVYQGDTFFDQFDFFNYSDPTNGLVNYVNRDVAMRNDNPLAYVDNDQAVIRVDNWSWLGSGQHRDSVRLESKTTYDGGLFIMDVEHAPTGCAVWPAYWTLGRAEQWPGAGEIDIIEGVHNNQHDQVTWHTSAGCTLTDPGNFSGTAIHNNCEANVVGGCGIVDWSSSSFGATFNSYGGGVYAMRWDNSSIDIWFFYRATVPQDIVQGNPKPTYQNWGRPSASLSNLNCDLKKYFRKHAIIINITLCGDWAGNTYQADGCSGSCNDRVMDPGNMDNATWVINSLRVYQPRTLEGLMSGALDLGSSRDAALVTAATSLALFAW